MTAGAVYYTSININSYYENCTIIKILIDQLVNKYPPIIKHVML